MNDRTGQTWAEWDAIFVVIGPPRAGYTNVVLHPVCVLEGREENFRDEGDIKWEHLPYMRRLE